VFSASGVDELYVLPEKITDYAAKYLTVLEEHLESSVYRLPAG
jgi:hypothetical protein